MPDSAEGMALWPFGRKKRKTNNQEETKMSIAKPRATDAARADPARSMTDVNSSKISRKPSRKGSQRRTRSKSRVLTKSPPSTTTDLEKMETLPSVPRVPRAATYGPEQFNEKMSIPTHPGANRSPLTEVLANREDIPSYHFQNTLSQSSIQPEKFAAEPAIPTLKARRSTVDASIPRRKSSKRKAEDHAREREIRALSSPIPISKRPQSNAGGLLARESKRIPGGLNRNLERPTSEVSLPVPDSMHSSKSDPSDTHAFKISAFDALSPRPTIRYSENPHFAANSGSLNPSRTSTRKDKRPSITEEEFNSKERINDLADEFDAGDLREVMERDRRRREKKWKSDHEKLERKLQRRSEKQRIEAATDQMTSEDSTKSRVEGLGLGPAGGSTSQPDRRPPETDQDLARSPASWFEDASRENELIENPFGDPIAETHLEPATPDERDEPIIETAKAIRLSAASVSPPSSPTRGHARGPSNLSTLNDLASRSNPDIQERAQLDSVRRGSDTSARLASSWTSFFRRSGTRGKRTSADRGREPPSEFSNTSRDSLARQVPSPAFVRNVKERSGTPVRTQSRFREDLPELPISPPMSRVQSPDLLPGSSPYIDHVSKISELAADTTAAEPRLSDVHPAYREEVVSLRGPSPENPSDAILSQSLASVDSEGSWLSGRPPKRSSQQINPMRSSGGSISQQLVEEETAEAGSPSFTRQTPSPRKAHVPGGITTQLHPRNFSTAEESDVESGAASPEEPVKMNTVVDRHPTIVQRNLRAKSREGLLEDFQALDDSPGSSHSAYSPEDAPSYVRDAQAAGSSIHRATSVDLGKSGHARHISAGSARLLDLPPRSSGELKRLSSGSLERSPLGSPLRATHENPETES